MLSNKLSIKTYGHCKRCIDEIQSGKAGRVSPRDYARLSFGFTVEGLQVWCVRHECNVIHIDFEGQTHPANMEATDEEDRGG